uniref:Uncharacterized protein n=1 Tax=Desulfovibrio sp. U5L TaxID=596152 RepID=I2Q152_9BACT
MHILKPLPARAVKRPGTADATRSFRLLLRLAGTTCCTVALLLALAVGPALAAKADTRSFNAAFASQSAKIYDHLLKVTDYYASLTKEGNTERIKDVLALRASLSACWELFLNAGDMVYVYDLLDPACATDVTRVGGLLKNGLGVIAGKLEKELQWMGLVEKNVGDLPVSVELAQARKDIEAAAASFRQAATLFEAPAGGETRQPVRP